MGKTKSATEGKKTASSNKRRSDKEAAEPSAYDKFLAGKAVTANSIGIDPDEPHKILFPHQRDCVKWGLRKGRAAFFWECGLGKGQPLDSKVLTPSGWRTIGFLKVGDKVISSDGKPHDVTGVYPKQLQPTYRVTFSDGTSIVVDDDHQHIVRTNRDRQKGRPWRVVSTNFLRNTNIRYGQEGKSRMYDIPIVSPVEMSEEPNRMVSPYVMGAILGDGHIKGNIGFTNADPEILSRIREELPDGVSLTKCQGNEYGYLISTGNCGNTRHPFREAFKEMKLLGRLSDRKFIPREYLWARSPIDRLALLQGLMDTDGYIGDSSTCEFSSCSEDLAEGVMFLVRSLGGIPKMKTRKTFLNGEQKKDSHRVTFSLKTFCPFHVERKAKKWNPAPRDNGRWIDSIQYEFDQKTVCISVDSPDHSYVTNDFIVTHNTFGQIEWGKQIPGNVIILAPLAVCDQTVEEAAKLGVIIKYCRDKSEVESGFTITNYDMVEHFDMSVFTGVIIDESSALRSYDSKFRCMVIDLFKDTPYRLACSATPSPNDYMELGNHAEFLGVMSRVEMLSMFFYHDGGETSKWILKGHAEKDFWKWVCSWAVMIRKPSDLGYSDDGFDLPSLTVNQITVDATMIPDGELFAIQASTLQERIKARRSSIGERSEKAIEIVNSEPDEKWLIWCNMNSEQDAIKDALGDECVSIYGSLSPEQKVSRLKQWLNGEKKYLVSKPSMLSWGINAQCCARMVFVGLSDSWEQYYQAVRRCWRFGQKRPVTAYVIASETEGAVVANIKRKEADAERMAQEMVNNMHDLNKAEIHGGERTHDEYKKSEKKGDGWKIRLGDCVEGARSMADNSVGFSIFSPPFASLYTYSASDRDMGNCKNRNEFYDHFSFLVEELFRILKPGRNVSFHCMNLPTSKARDGYIGISDFRGDLIRMFVEKGFIYHSEVVIWKDPVTAMQRTKALGLLHKQVKKDSCMSRQGIPDYLVTMRKPGEQAVEDRVSHTAEEFPVEQWQKFASPVWMDINPSDTLQFRSAREHKDERHICPLQLSVIERALLLWSKKGDLVYSPFTGIGSEAYQSIRLGRTFEGDELKESYWKQACKNSAAAKQNTASELDFFNSESESED